MKPESNSRPPANRGPRLNRLDYYPEFQIGREDCRDLWLKSFDDVLSTLRRDRPGWGLSVAIINPSTPGSGAFFRGLFEHVEPWDRCTLVMTTAEPFDPEIQKEVFGPRKLEVAPRQRAWPYENDGITREGFDVVFVGAQVSQDLDAARKLGKYASLIVVNSDGAMFNEIAEAETDPLRATFAFGFGADHLKPLMTRGTRASVNQYVENLKECDKSEPGRCVSPTCPARYVAQLLVETLNSSDPTNF